MVLSVVAGIVLGAAALAGPVHDLLVGWGWLEVPPNQPHKMFLKVFRRLLLIPLVAFVFLALRPWRDGSAATWGLVPRRPRLLATAWVLTLGCGVLVLALHFAFRWQGFERPLDPAKFAARFGQYLAVGFLIAIIEEWFFRAWLWTRLGRERAPLRSALITSAIYAGLHAFRPGALNELDVSHDMAGALDALGGWLGYLLDPAAFGPLFLGLFLFGLLLSGLYRRTGSLWAPIGVHAAGILLVYSHGGLTDGLAAPWFAGSKRLFDGLPGWGVLALGAWWAWRVPVTDTGRHRFRQDEP